MRVVEDVDVRVATPMLRPCDFSPTPHNSLAYAGLLAVTSATLGHPVIFRLRIWSRPFYWSNWD
jgi:hypothetical protein